MRWLLVALLGFTLGCVEHATEDDSTRAEEQVIADGDKNNTEVADPVTFDPNARDMPNGRDWGLDDQPDFGHRDSGTNPNPNGRSDAGPPPPPPPPDRDAGPPNHDENGRALDMG